MKRRDFCKIALSAAATCAGQGFLFPKNGYASKGGNVAKQGEVLIDNPYARVDWDSFGQYKAGMHMHTLQSDGWYSVAEVTEAYRKAGFSILSITDHDWNYPNFRVERDQSLADRATPYPKDPKPANFPANPTWPWTDYGGRSPQELGIVGIQGNELTFRHHIISYFNDYGVWYERTGTKAPYGGIVDANGNVVWEHDQLDAIARKGGLAVLCHPGIENTNNWWERKPLDWYVEHYVRHSPDCLIGIEVTNNSRATQAYDEGLWDQLLARFMPERPIWGFGADDMHRLERTKQTYNVFYLPECNESNVRKAMEQGQFCFTKSTRGINYLDGRSPDLFPTLERVEVDQTAGTITLSVRDCDEIRWITCPDNLEPLEDYRTSNAPYAGGVVVQEGPVLDCRKSGIDKYVRAEMIRVDGSQSHTLCTNPFGIRSVS